MGKISKQNKSFIIVCSMCLILFVLVFAIILNYLTNWNLGFNISQNSTWISFYASIIAAIIGGIISGGLTLGGVYITIKNSEKNELLDKLPGKILSMDYILSNSLDLDLLETLLYNNNYKDFYSKFYNLAENKQNILEKAANVNTDFYQIVKEYINIVDRVIFIHFNITDGIENSFELEEDVYDQYNPIIWENISDLSTVEKLLKKEYEGILEKYKEVQTF
ncbi:hypothetical protein [Lysinibacillus tabacifolii]|uniref:Uncharacterized protein n=1 Tax=Lysinibacillus tabacifolii TaxID=1173107 RepID=A0ABY2T2M4_9BACI|nr:hypothetical protein [Lysinibacillus tabacifolii]TKI50279.1 hypothetical protein FC748_03425 [Lysinibacillus tabacifolii]